MELSSFPHRLEALGRCLQQDGYAFSTPTPVTHARVLARSQPGPDVLRDTFGWNKLVCVSDLPPAYRGFLHDPDLFGLEGGRHRAKLRFSTLGSPLGPLLLAHSGFPTIVSDAVFFGPDTYRFAHAIQDFAARTPNFMPRTCLDIGAGSGAGGLLCGKLFPSLSKIALLDINPRALEFAAANIALNGIGAAILRHSDILSGWRGEADLIVANPPYLNDPAHRTYRDGGGSWGEALSVRILGEALARLSAHGHLLLYTGSTIVDGEDQFLKAAMPLLRQCTEQYRYDEIDPDVFGEELDKWPYDKADRIATVLLHVRGSDLQRIQDASDNLRAAS